LALKDPNKRFGAELLEDVAWDRTKAYAIGFGAIYLNQAGREKYGIVTQGEESAALKRELAQKLTQWRDQRDDKSVIRAVYRNEELFHGPYAAEAPDLYIGFQRGYRASWQTALGAVPESLLEDNAKQWAGDHLFDPSLVPGVLFVNKRITKAHPSLYDIAPTLLRLAGYTRDEIKKIGLEGDPLGDF
jgi:predicted AlkP superfamily phosphohydrolase/phosphomutase